ncbi:PREDICTED: alpha-crystallin domain-containing protein 22.3-like isoform X2 [Theobroma cacao]|uniref:Alpha-crystallin domain-containing protein 22.3-like isoform X2 n=1 Tax=Theobroma cacao TaxID=3641 RepID=A0AB32WF68_THECC|nr:PREDICTED: alpha-crystallin domain-containing protein 22.3-like isoform X2 [Theobroma cacao]
MNSQTVSSGEDGNDLSERLRALNLNDGVLRSDRTEGENNEPNSMNPQQPVLDVPPLSCVHYIGPPSPGDTFSSPTKEQTEASERIGPAMIFLPSQSTREELDNMMAHTKYGVALTGAAATGSIGPLRGLRNISESEDSYHFRVNVPGASMEKGDFSCDIEPDGTVVIKGISTTGEKVVHWGSLVFEMLTQNLGPLGPFTISFQLPGPVNPQEVVSRLADGIFEAIVKKK